MRIFLFIFISFKVDIYTTPHIHNIIMQIKQNYIDR